MTTAVQQKLRGIMPHTQPAYIDDAAWGILHAHINLARQYKEIAAALGKSASSVQRRAHSAARKIEQQAAQKAFPRVHWFIARQLWQRGYREADEVCAADDALLLRVHTLPSAGITDVIAHIRAHYPAWSVPCPHCQGSGRLIMMDAERASFLDAAE